MFRIRQSYREDVEQILAVAEYLDTVNLPGYHVPGRPDPTLLRKTAALLMKSRRPVLYVGHGAVVSNAGKAILQLARKLEAPIVNTLLNAPRTAWWCWRDFNPALAGSGQVKFEQSGGVAYVTFDGVWGGGGTGPANASTFQFQFETGSGLVHLVFQATSAIGGPTLVGYSPGGSSFDPGNTDISAVLPATIPLQPPEVLPLRLTARPRRPLSIRLSTASCNMRFSLRTMTSGAPSSISRCKRLLRLMTRR